MLPIGQPSNGKMPGEKLPLKVGYFWTGLVPSYPLLFVAKLYHNQKQDGADICNVK